MKGSPTRNGPAEAGKSVGIDQRERDGMIVRAVLGITESLWRVVTGYLFDGSRVSRDAEVFSGVGFYARPPTSANAEAIVVSVGGDASSGMIVATRDEATRKAVAGAIVPDETILFNSVAIVYIKATGVVEIRLPGGAAVPLALKSDVEALANHYKVHTHGGVTTGAGISAVPTTAGTTPAAVGTSVIKGQ